MKNNKNVRGFSESNYSKLDSDGLVEVGLKVEENDIIIGKTTPIVGNDLEEFIFKDASTSLRYNESGTVDKVLISNNIVKQNDRLI